jgi:hypothetical protein
MTRPRTPPGRFLASGAGNGHGYRTRPLRDLPIVADELEVVDRIREATNIRDEPETIGPAILASYAEVNRRILTQQHIIEVAEAQERRPELTPQNRLADIQRRAKNAHVDLSHEIHLVQRAIDKARLRDQPVHQGALDRMTGLEALLDGVWLLRSAA